MVVTPEQIETFIEVYGQTRHQGAAGAAAGVSTAWVTQRKKNDPEFRRRLVDAANRLDGAIMARTADVALRGAPRETINPRTGEPVVLRSYCKGTTIAYLEQYCGWHEQDSSGQGLVKQVELVDEGEPVRLLDVMRAKAADERGIQIEPVTGEPATTGTDTGTDAEPD